MSTLLVAIMLYGNLMLTGVAEEKSSRVVEVLLARMPACNLLAGKVAGIGMLRFCLHVSAPGGYTARSAIPG
jgi:ABC-2 type transport system permease protein